MPKAVWMTRSAIEVVRSPLAWSRRYRAHQSLPVATHQWPARFEAAVAPPPCETETTPRLRVDVCRERSGWEHAPSVRRRRAGQRGFSRYAWSTRRKKNAARWPTVQSSGPRVRRGWPSTERDLTRLLIIRTAQAHRKGPPRSFGAGLPEQGGGVGRNTRFHRRGRTCSRLVFLSLIHHP